MKLAHALPILFLLSAFALNAQEYQAPKIKWKKNRNLPVPKPAQAGEFKDFGENSYRVHEDPYKDRNLASEKEEDGREPSSEIPKEDFAPIPQPWKYKKEYKEKK